MERAGERHVAAIAPAHDHDSVRVEVRLLLDPVEERADVLHRVLALESVVELEERLPEPGRAADVRVDHRDPELADEVVVAPEEDRPRLTLGAAVDVDDHRALAGEARGRRIKEAGDLEA